MEDGKQWRLLSGSMKEEGWMSVMLPPPRGGRRKEHTPGCNVFRDGGKANWCLLKLAVWLCLGGLMHSLWACLGLGSLPGFCHPGKFSHAFILSFEKIRYT